MWILPILLLYRDLNPRQDNKRQAMIKKIVTFCLNASLVETIKQVCSVAEETGLTILELHRLLAWDFEEG